MLIWSKIGAWFAPNVPQAWKSFWTHTMEQLGDMGHVESLFDPFGDSVTLDERQVRGLRRAYHRLRNPFGCTHGYSLVTWVMWNLIWVHSEIELLLMQDRCTGCAERTTGSGIFLDAPNGTPRGHGSSGITFHT
jgi:hypothetical protein